MAIDRKEIQVASRKFRQAASNLYNCNFEDYNIFIERLLSCIESDPFIKKYVDDCIADSGFEASYIDSELASVKANWGATFDVYPDEEKQAAFTYLILQQAIANSDDIVMSFCFGYSRSTHLQDWADAFTKRFVSTLIDSVSGYLEEQLIISGSTESNAPLVAVQGDQAHVNIADHGSRIVSSVMHQSNPSDLDQSLDSLLLGLKNALTPNEYHEAEELAETIKEEARTSKPKKGVVKAAFNALKAMANAANLTAALLTIEQAIQPLLG